VAQVSLRSRLDLLVPVLAARERALLLLRCLKEDREEDPEIRRGMPSSQTREINQYIGLMNSANRELASLVRVLAYEVEGLEHHNDWYQALLEWQKNAGELAPLVHPLRDELKATLRAALVLRWQELRAVEIVWDEIAEEFGEDPVHSALRNEVRDSKATVRRLVASLGRKPTLVEPTEAILDGARDLVRRAKEFAL